MLRADVVIATRHLGERRPEITGALIFVLFYGFVPIATSIVAYFVIKRSYSGRSEQ
jgi:hypothetical protein